jgi:hypothetical protein
MTKAHRVLAQLHSWKTGYISPTAQILMGDAADLIQEQIDTIAKLDAALDEARERIKELTRPKSKPKAKSE